MTNQINPRGLALKILLEVLEEGKLYHTVLRSALKTNEDLSKQDRALITRICTGTIEHMMTLDYVIDLYAKTKTSKMKPVIRNILRLSVYQLLYMSQIPESAICNEAVKLTKKFGFQTLSGFVNGILRNIMRQKNMIEYPSEAKDEIYALQIQYSVPEWLVKELLNQYGKEITKKILNASFETKETTIRCNLSKVNKEQLTEELIQCGVSVRPGDYIEEALKITDYDALEKLSAFREGKFFIQDESSMLVGLAAGIKKDAFVLDTCAAPGGKTMHAAYFAKQVYSQDVSDKKVDKIKQNLSFYGFTNVITKVWDASVINEEYKEKFDVVIADVPCSGLGVFGKKPDIKYKVTKNQLENLVKLQRDILTTVQTYVKPGGTLIYSTCTINTNENIKNVQWLLENYKFQLESLVPYLPKKFDTKRLEKGYLQLIPGVDLSDGFFLARLKRI